MSGRDDTSFLSRWSRLKREGGDAPAPAGTGPGEAAEPAGEEKSDAEILAEHGLPDPDALGPEDDVSGFMHRAIPERLRNRALRKLWLRNPVLANLDELVDYGEDFTDAATVVENLATAWQVGRGYPPPEPPPQETETAGGEEAGEDSRGPEPPARALDAREEAPPAHGLGNAAQAGDGPAAESAGTAPADPPPAPRRRRMAFRFADGEGG